MEPIFLEGVLQDKIWGGTKLRDEFGYDIPTETTGEHWSISAHPNGPATIKNGEHAGKTLAELWDSNRELFGNQEGDVFPLLTKIIDANNDLSVQVHPDDAYGLENEGELGKTECWYILSADEGAEIVFGHHANSKEEYLAMIEKGTGINYFVLLKFTQAISSTYRVEQFTQLARALWCWRRNNRATRRTDYTTMTVRMTPGTCAICIFSNQSTFQRFLTKTLNLK